MSKLSFVRGALICSTLFSIISCSTIGLKPEAVKPKKTLFTASWIKNLDVDHSTGNLPIGLQSPAMGEEILYVGQNNGTFYAFNKENGRPIWKVSEGHSYHASPVIFKEKVLYGNVEGRLFARNRFTGELVYNVDLGSAVESEPVLYQGRLLVHTRNHKVVCLDAETGKILWAYKRAVPFLTTLQRVSQPLVYQNRIYVGFADGFTVAFSLEEGAILWETKVVNGNKFIDVDTHPTLFDGKIIVGSQSGEMSILNARSGFIERRLPYFVARAPLILKDQMIVGTTDGEVVFLNSGLKETKKLKISEDGITSLALWEGDIVASTTGGYLMAISQKSKEVVDSFHFGHASSALFGSLIVKGNLLAAYSSRNRLYVFRR